MAPSPPSSSPSLPMVKMMLCLVGSVHNIIINDDIAPHYRSVGAFSLPYAHRVAYSTATSSLSSRDGLSSKGGCRCRLHALPSKSPSDATTRRQESTQQDRDGRPFFLQNTDGRVDNDTRSDGNNGGMDAYARQMQDFADNSSGAAAATDTAEPRMESPSPPPYPPMGQRNQSEPASSSPDAPASSAAMEDQPISSVDARVLESILSEGKLDLSTEDQVKKLLDGPRLQEGEEYPSGGAGEDMDGKYNSKFVSAVSDNAFWNSMKAKAAEIIDSVGIYIENRIERDAQTLAAVGLFTLDRIRRDIGRALPAAGRATRNFLLSTNSSYAEQFLDVTDQTPFALPAERTATDREMLGDWTDLYDELTTPADEIRQVTGAIRDILAGKELPDDYASSR
eukprot:CAMPEP_0181130774 /NCGR_PEP_ID=MMETSP1071-20121207/30048_1 /TAXON_ID=35127 /ORGANISM="Thalassiosira sp., Strain NH16" /LENGTH=394 /DNA_ID=CAMNT_0023216877 /DNA_START=18 /DNA_END=1202 /DNA_ORIENTATION=-